ncbi:MAG: AAA family ATPase, partial [bacterium]
LLLKGARQVGKTFSLKKFGKEFFKSCHYINFEKDDQVKKVFASDLVPQRIINELSFYLNTSIDLHNDLIILDEIQHCPRALTSLKYFAEELPFTAICSAGSLLGVHLAETNFPVGKIDFLNLYPLSFEEFLQGIGKDALYTQVHNLNMLSPQSELIHASLWELLKLYFVIGGLPEVVTTYKNTQTNMYDALNAVRENQNALIIAYLADIAKHSGKENSMHIERVWQSIPAQLSRTHDGSSSKFKFKGVVPGIKGFNRLSGAIDWLKAAGLIIQTSIINRAALPLKAYQKDNFFKLYSADVGLLGALSGLPPKTIFEYDYGSYKGYFAENFIAQEFLAHGLDTFFCWQERTAELEFVQQYEGEILPIEVKSGWVTRAKSLNVFAEKYHPPFKTIMSGRNISIDKQHKTYKIPIYLASKFPMLLSL